MQANFVAPVFVEYLRGLINSPGDFLLQQGDYKFAPMTEIVRFRDTHYGLHSQTYLLSEQQRHFEDMIGTDRRSHHLWVTRHGQIVGAMRATPAPYELAVLAPPDVWARCSYPKRLEFGRLVSTGTGEDVAVISKKLIAGACLFGVIHGFQGVIAMCKSPQRRLFERFGLSAVSPQFAVPERNEGQYWLVQASWQKIIDAIPPTAYGAAGAVAALCTASNPNLLFTD